MDQTGDGTGRCGARGTGPRSPPAGNLVEAPSAFGMRSYMRNDPAEEEERGRESGGDRGA